MNTKTLYQTVDNKDNPDEVENKGPFLCKRTPWLGKGYYFWDSFIELAHWWGRQGYANNYMICEAICNDNPNDIFDLLGNTDHMKEMRMYKELLEKRKQKEKITPAFILMHMQKHSGSFHYAAIRACGIDSINKDYKLRANRMIFKEGNRAYLDLTPAIQICVLDKKKIGLSNYRVIFPTEYCQYYVV